MRTHHLAASALTLLLCLLLCGCATAPSRKHALLLASGDEGHYWKNLIAVSYTHLDVYKRQSFGRRG